MGRLTRKPMGIIDTLSLLLALYGGVSATMHLLDNDLKKAESKPKLQNNLVIKQRNDLHQWLLYADEIFSKSAKMFAPNAPTPTVVEIGGLNNEIDIVLKGFERLPADKSDTEQLIVEGVTNVPRLMSKINTVSALKNLKQALKDEAKKLQEEARK